jgi:hypothetical protein
MAYEKTSWAVLAMSCASGHTAPEPLLDWIESISTRIPPFTRFSLHPLHAEFVGLRLMRELGIGSAPAIEVVSQIQARKKGPENWVFKSLRGPALKQADGISGDLLLAVRKIPGAISLSALSRKFGIAPERIQFQSCKRRRFIEAITSMLQAGKSDWDEIRKEQASDASWNALRARFFDDFMLPELPEARLIIERAIAADSEQMLAIHAARIFLGCSAAHASNVLVDGTGRLYSIDHEMVAKDAGELEWTFRSIQRGTPAAAALERISELTEAQLTTIFEGLQEVPRRSHMLDQENAVRYFVERLRRWKSHCAIRFSGSRGSSLRERGSECLQSLQSS